MVLRLVAYSGQRKKPAMSKDSGTVPSNADRAALAKIVGLIQEYEDADQSAPSGETVIREIQHIAVVAVNDSPQPETTGTVGSPTLNTSTPSRSPCGDTFTIFRRGPIRPGMWRNWPV
jgi:hypothetical protein